MNIKQQVTKRIIEITKNRGMTYNELANLCGITPSTIYSILDNNRKNISIVTIKKICDGLEITLGEFFNTDDFNNLEQEIK